MQGKRLELCFVQFYEVLNEKSLTVDQIDSTPDFTKLQYYQTRRKEGVESTRNVNDSVTVRSLLIIVHIVEMNENIDKVPDSILCSNKS